MSSLTTFDAFLKYNYGNADRVQKLLYTDNPFLAFIKKTGGVKANGGEAIVSPVQYASGQAISSSFSSSQTIAAASGGSIRAQKWVIDWGDYYANLLIDDKLLMLSKGENSAYLEARQAEIDGLHKQFAFNLNGYLLRSRARNLGSGTNSTGVLTLTNADDVVHYQVGMQIQASANDGSATGHALLGSGSIGYVIAVNPNAGTVTVSESDNGSAATPASWTGTMYFFRLGDFGGTSTPNKVVDGFDDWCPSSDPSATAFNTVDRTAHIIACSGVRLTSSEIAGLSTEQRMKRLATRMANRGFGSPTAMFLNPEKWQDVADGLESRGIREIGKDATFGFRSLQIATGGGTVEVYSDRCVPPSAVYALTGKESFELRYPQDQLAAPVSGDGLQMMRKYNANSYEYRLALYPAVVATPGHLGRCTAA